MYPNNPGYVRGSDTSEAAAKSVVDAKTGRYLVCEYIRRCGAAGATCDEIEAGLGMRHQTASARLAEARRLWLVWDSGERRKTRSGRSAAVYVTCGIRIGSSRKR